MIRLEKRPSPSKFWAGVIFWRSPDVMNIFLSGPNAMRWL